MNDYKVQTRKRGQTLLIVEGNHEKNELFKLLFKCFPEINISIDNVWIYGTNIYMLYDDITKEYGADWVQDDTDVDLPLVISKKMFSDSLRYKDDFTNIFLVFDYERHDPKFSEKKILNMQKKFSDTTDMGKLYINYPMIESYQHLKSLPDEGYKDRKVPVSLQPGKMYKKLVSNESIIEEIIDFPNKIDDAMKKEISDAGVRSKCCDEILRIHTHDDMLSKIENVFSGVMNEMRLNTWKYTLKDWVVKKGHLDSNISYWQYLKAVFTSIIRHNICKANMIQNGTYEIEENEYRKYFEDLDLNTVLKMQNQCSKDDKTGYIWVLNTSVFLVADYNFKILE